LLLNTKIISKGAKGARSIFLPEVTALDLFHLPELGVWVHQSIVRRYGKERTLVFRLYKKCEPTADALISFDLIQVIEKIVDSKFSSYEKSAGFSDLSAILTIFTE
jgi:hypothetical protein